MQCEVMKEQDDFYNLVTDEQYPWKITDEILAKLAKKIGADPRSLQRRLIGLPVRGRRGWLVDRALRTAGYEPRSAVPRGKKFCTCVPVRIPEEIGE